jgi:hypothetical protein
LLKPRSVSQAVIAIWVTIALDALVITIEGSTGVMTPDVLLLNSMSCVFYGLLANRIAAGNNFARHVYAILVAVEVAALLALGLDGATELEATVASISSNSQTTRSHSWAGCLAWKGSKTASQL